MVLTTEPHSEVMVAASYTNGPEKATSGEDGVLRDDEGRAFSEGVYEIVEVMK